MSDNARRPPFRADHVGSLLRPPELLAARERRRKGEIGADALRAAEDAAIRDAVRLQEAAGLHAITDGEFRRENWWIDFISAIEGIRISDPDAEAGFSNAPGTQSGYLPKTVSTVAKVRRTRDIVVSDYVFLKGATAETPKITIPSPVRIHFHGGNESVDRTVYPDMDAFWDDIAKVYQEEIAALEAAGCRYIQIDDPTMNYLVDPRQHVHLRQRGEDPAALLGTYVRALNACIAKRRPDTWLSYHLCKGNARSAWLAEGAYDPIADVLFPSLGVDAWFLEYDDARSGSFAPLRFVPEDKLVVLGLVTTKRGDMERKDDLKRRIDEAAKVVPLERLALSPQCGFASIDLGNLISVEEEAAKLRLVVETAEEVWGES